MSSAFPSRRTAIVSTATHGIKGAAGLDALQLLSIAANKALRKAGLRPSDVDGLFCGLPLDFLSGLNVAEYMGISPNVSNNNRTGGSSFMTHVMSAALALDAGLCDVALVAYGSAQRSEAGKLQTPPRLDPIEGGYGLRYPIGSYALAAARHMHEFGTTREHLAEVAVAARGWANLNPEAFAQGPLTLEDVLDARMVCDPLGFFGKVPTHGDFVSSGMSAGFQDALDQWLQAGLKLSEETFGKEWRPRFRAMPAWRFVVPSGLWGPATHAGVLLPNSDRVGRSFPLAVVAQLTAYRDDPRLLCFDDTWFTAAEALAETSRSGEFDLGNFPQSVKRLRLPYAHDDDDGAQGEGKHFLTSALWWTIDPETRKARGFRTDKAPAAVDFLKLFDAARPADAAVEDTASAAKDPAEELVMVPPRVPEERPALRRSYATHPGTRLTVNGDALLLSDNPFLFAVADGIGDGARAAESAKMIANALSGTAAQETLASLVQEVKGKLGRAQGLLQAAANGADCPQASVVALLGVGANFAVVWAGDARCYLMRDGTMRALTRDHVEVGLRRRLARSVGGQRQLVPDVVADSFKRGDCILICSAPLPRTLDERTIAAVLGQTPTADAAAALVQESLIAGVRDNVSAIVIGVERE